MPQIYPGCIVHRSGLAHLTAPTFTTEEDVGSPLQVERTEDLWASRCSSSCLIPSLYPPSPSSASQLVCSLICSCPEPIDEALVSSGMFIGEKRLAENSERSVRRSVHLNTHLKALRSPTWTNTSRSDGRIPHTGSAAARFLALLA